MCACGVLATSIPSSMTRTNPPARAARSVRPNGAEEPTSVRPREDQGLSTGAPGCDLDRRQHFRRLPGRRRGTADPLRLGGHRLRLCLRVPRAFKEALAEGLGALLLEARRRALHGTPKLVPYRGRPVTIKDPQPGREEYFYETEYSDRLAIALLRIYRPQKYG